MIGATVLVRKATEDDIDRIAEIHLDSRRVAYSGLLPADRLTLADRVAAWHERWPRVNVIVAQRDNRVIGWLSFGASRDDDTGNGAGEVFAMYVDPGTWRSGAGSALWAEARRRFAEDGMTRASVWVLENNDRARRFYERMGFVPDGAVKDLVIDGASYPGVRYVYHSGIL